MMCVLDICIPTYNRIDKLTDTLSKVIRCIERAGLEDKVSVIVSNNASTDGTKEFLDSFSQKYFFVDVYHQERNIGFSANLLYLWKKSHSRYIWSISDDDFYGDQLITKLIGVISECENLDSVLLLNSFHFVGDGSDRKVVVENLLGVSSPRELIRYDLGLKKIVNAKNFTAFGLLGALVFPKAWIGDLLEKPELKQSSYPHQLLLFKCLYDRPLAVLNYPMGLGWRAEDSNWSLAHVDRSFQAHFLDYIYLLDCTVNYLDFRIRKSIYRVIYRNAFWAIICYMHKHHLGLKWVWKYIFSKHVSYRLWVPKLDILLLLFSGIKISRFRGMIKSLASGAR